MGATQLLAMASIGGISRAERQSDGRWVVEQRLAGQDVRCLVASPDDPALLYAGSPGEWTLSLRRRRPPLAGVGRLSARPPLVLAVARRKAL
jgi:hypothetical protein